MDIKIENTSPNIKYNNSNYILNTKTIINNNVIKSILIVEDDPDRMSWFIENLKDNYIVTHTDNAKTAKYLLKHKKYDMMFLDHDLGGEQMASIADENTGSRVADEIYALDIKVPVILHSHNPIGVKYMLNKLDHAKALPFGTFTIETIWE
ncbi:MAG: response regulator [Ignavibacteriae bacterium]|nr:response regulator [Ignavibacteriota bacterium]